MKRGLSLKIFEYIKHETTDIHTYGDIGISYYRLELYCLVGKRVKYEPLGFAKQSCRFTRTRDSK